MKIIDKKQRQKKEERDDTCYSKSVRTKWSCCASKLGFFQLICQASLIFKSNLELALSITLKKESKHVVVECRCLKIGDLLSFLIYSSILVLKWWQVSPMQLELQLAQVNVYTRKDFKSSGIGSLCENRFLILNELKTNLKFSLWNSLQSLGSLFICLLWKIPDIL